MTVLTGHLPEILRLFAVVELAIIVAYLFMFVVIALAIVAIVMRVPTLLRSPTETACAFCGDTRWCRELHGRMICQECRMDVQPRKRWWQP